MLPRENTVDCDSLLKLDWVSLKIRSFFLDCDAASSRSATSAKASWIESSEWSSKSWPVFLLPILPGRRDGLGSGTDDMKNWLFTTPSLLGVSKAESEQSRCLLDGFGTDRLPAVGSVKMRLGGCGAVLGNDWC